jgi:hypothetical protein
MSTTNYKLSETKRKYIKLYKRWENTLGKSAILLIGTHP